MRAVGNHCSARTISLALAAGLMAFGAALMLGVGSPDLPLVRVADESAGVRAKPGGETTISKLAEAARSLQTDAAAPDAEPQLKGLGGDIPWEREEPAKTKPAPRPTNMLAQAANATNALPWDAIEPVPFTHVATPSTTRPKTRVPDSGPVLPAPKSALPATGDVKAWVKAKATTLKGENRGRPIYHFELWLDAPAEIKQRVVAVAYDFNTPAVMPQSQVSSEGKTGFRVSVGGLACADNITVTLKFDDGRSQQVAVDSCRLLS